MCEYERKNAVNEVRMLASLDHPHIVKFVSGMFDNNEDDLYLFMEYAPYGDLANLIEQAKDKKKCIPENTIWQILLHVSEGTLSSIQAFNSFTKTTSFIGTSSQPTSSGQLTAPIR